MREKKTFSYVYIAIILLFLYLPVVFVVVYSFNVSKTSAIWKGFTLDWYGILFRDHNIGKALINSLKVGVLTTLLSAVIGASGAVATHKLAMKIKAPLNALIYLPLVVPEIIMAVALIMMFSKIPFLFGIPALVISHSAFCIPYIYLMTGIRLLNIDKSLVEAARDLGAGSFYAFRTITLPLIMPSVISGSLLAFAMSMDDVVISSFVSGPGSQTLPMRIFSMLKLGVTPEINALCSIMLLVTFTGAGLLQFVFTIKKPNNNKRGIAK